MKIDHEDDALNARLAIAKAKREARGALYDKDVATWTDAELIGELAPRYEPAVVPPCRVCGAELSCQAFGGGPTIWACDGREEDPTCPGFTRLATGRRAADDHYERSRWEDQRRGGDGLVMEALRRLAERSDA